MKMSEIHHFILAFGWILFLITQMFRPIWQNIGNTVWGYLWISEILETIPYVMIWYGFTTPSKYHKISKRQSKSNDKRNKKKDIVVKYSII